MANSFTNNKKVKLIAKTVADNMDYVKKAHSYMSQDQLKGKKYGMSFEVYIPDPGKVQDGLVTDPDEIVEVPVTVTLQNKNTSCEIDSWDEITNIEDFQGEIVKPRATKLAKEIQKDAIKQTIFRAAQAVVADAPSFEVLSEGAAALQEASVAGNIVSFLAPSEHSKIAATGLAKYIPDDIQKKIYTKNYLGEYAGASQISLANMPVITTPASASTFSVTLTPVTDDDSNTIGFEAIKSGTGTNLFNGVPFKAAGLKLVDVNGVETDQDFIVIADANGNIPELRITVEGKAYGNPNAWVAAGTSTLTFTPLLDTETKYAIGQVRTEDALGFDTYKFNKLAGVDDLGSETVDGVRVEVVKGSNVLTRQSCVRIDCPFCVTLPETRNAVALYIKK